jgi:hypothetical protein
VRRQNLGQLAHVTAWWCEVFGGPAHYSKELGGCAAMVTKHQNLGITAEQRGWFVELMSRAADGAGLPDDLEFAQPSSLTSSGEPGSHCRTLNPVRLWSAKHRFLDGVGEKLPHTSADDAFTVATWTRPRLGYDGPLGSRQ